MIKCVPLNMSEYLEAQAKSKAYASLALLQIKVTPPLKLKAGDTMFIISTIDHFYGKVLHSDSKLQQPAKKKNPKELLPRL